MTNEDRIRRIKQSWLRTECLKHVINITRPVLYLFTGDKNKLKASISTLPCSKYKRVCDQLQKNKKTVAKNKKCHAYRTSSPLLLQNKQKKKTKLHTYNV